MGDISRRPGAALTQLTLPVTHPLFPRYAATTLGMRTAAERTMAALVLAAPGHGKDPEANLGYLTSLPGARVLNQARDRGSRAAEPLTTAAHEMSLQQASILENAESALTALESLDDEVVAIVSEHVRRGDIPALLDEVNAAAARAESHGDLSHLEPDSPGAMEWIVTPVITGFEAFGLYALLVNLSTPQTWVMFLCLVGVLALANHVAAKQLGRAIREYRQLNEARTEAHSRGFALLNENN